jgi:hypothetical protein
MLIAYAKKAMKIPNLANSRGNSLSKINEKSPDFRQMIRGQLTLIHTSLFPLFFKLITGGI